MKSPRNCAHHVARGMVLVGSVVWVLSAQADSLGCLIGPSRIADVGSPVIGVLESVAVERGAQVKRGQVLATLRAEVERAQVGLAASRARTEGELAAAQQAWDFAEKRRERAQDLFRQEFVSGQALEQAAAEAEVAKARLAQAREQVRHLAHELGLASAQLDQRTIRSPIDGVVLERYLDAGARVDEKPILRLATVNPLRAEVVLPAALYGQVKVGDMVTVRPDLVGLPTVQGAASVVDNVIEPASNTFRVRVELPNALGRIPAGARCKAALTAGRVSPAPTADSIKPVGLSSITAPLPPRTVPPR